MNNALVKDPGGGVDTGSAQRTVDNTVILYYHARYRRLEGAATTNKH